LDDDVFRIKPYTGRRVGSRSCVDLREDHALGGVRLLGPGGSADAILLEKKHGGVVSETCTDPNQFQLSKSSMKRVRNAAMSREPRSNFPPWAQQKSHGYSTIAVRQRAAKQANALQANSGRGAGWIK